MHAWQMVRGTASRSSNVLARAPCSPSSYYFGELVVANSRIEDGVQEVGDQVEGDHDDRDDHEPGHHGVWIAREQGVDEVVAHARRA
jgi:hypothetical protein